jgi:alpha-N-arabinofuranosidase
VKRADNVTFGNFTANDNFDSDRLGNEWLTLRGDAKDFYTVAGGSLNIKCAPVRSNSRNGVIPYVGRRIQHHNFTASTRLKFKPANESERAGLLILKDESHQYLIARGKNGKSDYITLLKIGRNSADELAIKHISKKCESVDLKVESDGDNFSFSYSTDNGKHWKTLADGIDARYTSTAEAGGFTGTTIGMYATNMNY